MSSTKLTPFNLPREDLDHIIKVAMPGLKSIDGSRIFLTGGTGFFGKWLLGSIIHANRELRTNISVDVLTRNQEKRLAEWPAEYSETGVNLSEGDIVEFHTPVKTPDYIIHGAADTVSSLDPAATSELIAHGAENIARLVDWAKPLKTLFLSSGAVYDRLTLDRPFSERDLKISGPASPQYDYGTGKRNAEYFLQSIDCISARCFAFVGPYLPLDKHFAIGNFINDGLQNRQTRILGDGRAIRSYMYPTDLVIWLLHLLFKGRPGQAYNVGSEHQISISDLANTVARLSGNHNEVVITKKSQTDDRNYYVPNTEMARSLGLEITVGLDAAISKTITWLRNQVIHGST